MSDYIPLPNHDGVQAKQDEIGRYIYPNSHYFRGDIYTTDEYYIFHYKRKDLLVQYGNFFTFHVPDVGKLLQSICDGWVISSFTPAARPEIAHYESKFYSFMYRIHEKCNTCYIVLRPDYE